MAKHGHEILRMLPYHCIFYLIKHVHGITKTYYIAQKSGRMETSLELCKEAVGTLTSEV